MNRTSIALSVLAAAGLGASDAGREALTAVIPPAAAQQPGEADERAGQSEQRAGSESDSQIARADEQSAGAEGIPVMALSAAQSDEHGEYVTDEHGRALYLLESEDDGESRCYDECAQQWPPAIAVQAQAGAGEDQPVQTQQGVDEQLLGTFERRDGSTQITYGDYPLYYYYQDITPGEASGHDVMDEWGEWYLVTPDGEPAGHGDETAQN